MEENFLLTTPLAERLYFDVAQPLPLCDWHNHLDMTMLREDRPFADPADLWLTCDPYKHRALRILGCPEQAITGPVSGYEKFALWCEKFPLLAGSPLWDWSALELKRCFKLNLPVCKENAGVLWQKMSAKLGTPRTILGKFDLRYAAPCADFTEDLTPFEGMDGFAPSLRGDRFFADLPGVAAWLEARYGEKITGLDDFFSLTERRLGEFHRLKCRFADHALDAPWCYVPDDGRNEARFAAVLRGEAPDAALQSELLRRLAKLYRRHDWVLQLHMGALRHTSDRLRLAAGPAGGYAAFDGVPVSDLTALLNDLERADDLPRVILYAMEPSQYPQLAVLSGAFNRAEEPGLVSLGPAWWWSDHLRGMEETFEAVARYGVLSAFPGMTTDSRSLLSLCRHEYYRRCLCRWLGEQAARGDMTSDFTVLSVLVRRLCWENARDIITKRGITL